MTTLQPILALILAALCALLSGLPPGEKRLTWPGLWSTCAYVAFLAAAAVCAIKLGNVDDHRAVFASMLAGGVVAIAASVFSRLSISVSVSLAVAGACVPHLVRADSFPEVCLVYAFSLAMGAVFFGSSQGVKAAGVSGGLVTMTDYLGKAGDEVANRALIGVVLGLGLCVGAVLVLAVRKADSKAMDRMESGLVALLAAGAGFAVSKWAVGGSLWIVLGIAAVSGLVVHWLVPPDGDPAPLRVGIAAVIWLALSTIGFSLLGGFGMSAAVLQGAMVLVIIGNGRGILTMGPALGLVIYRVMRDASPDSSRALDLGQHYGITGVAVGAVIPMMYADWFERKRSDQPATEAVAALLWGFALVCLPILSIVVLGSKGASGVVVGLGFSGFLLAYRKLSDSPIIAIVIAAGAANAVAVDWIGDAMELTRQEKLHSFGWWAFATAVAAVGILAVSRPKREEAAS